MLSPDYPAPDEDGKGERAHRSPVSRRSIGSESFFSRKLLDSEVWADRQAWGRGVSETCLDAHSHANKVPAEHVIS